MSRGYGQRDRDTRGGPRRRCRAMVRGTIVRGAATLALLLPPCGCDPHGTPVTAPVAGVRWTRITAVGAPAADHPDWRADSIVYQAEVGDVASFVTAHESGTGAVFHPAVPPTGEREPRWVGPGLVVVSTDRSGDRDLWYRDASATGARRLTAFAGDEVSPAPRPGAPGLVYIERTGAPGGRIVLVPDTSAIPLERRYLTPTSLVASEPDWRPDGMAIAFAVSDAGGATHIWKLSLADTLPVQLTTGPRQDRGARWSPDGARILFASDRGSRWGLWTVSPLGEAAELRAWAYDLAGAEIRHPAWSPDGTRILLSSDRSGERALWVLTDLGLPAPAAP